jgi:hypothetical protein
MKTTERMTEMEKRIHIVKTEIEDTSEEKPRKVSYPQYFSSKSKALNEMAWTIAAKLRSSEYRRSSGTMRVFMNGNEEIEYSPRMDDSGSHLVPLRDEVLRSLRKIMRKDGVPTILVVSVVFHSDFNNSYSPLVDFVYTQERIR